MRIRDFLLYQDESLLVFDKPAGLLTIPDRYIKNEPNLRELAAQYFGPVWVVHRIDRETSGVLVMARNEKAHQQLNEAFETREVQKNYLAICRGEIDQDSLTIDRPLRVDADRQHRTVIDAYRGKEAITSVSVLERFRGYTYLTCSPETGRTHQIRVHLAEHQLPIVCDGLYGDGQSFLLSAIKHSFKIAAETEERPLLSRLALHAASIRFEHPEQGEELTFEAPLPKDMKAVLQQLSKWVPYKPAGAGLGW